MTYEFEVSSLFPVSCETLFDGWLDGPTHTAMTGSLASVENFVGGEHSAWDGYIHGTIIELDRPRRIVQTWRTPDFKPSEVDSIVEVTLTPVKDSTLLTLRHSLVPTRLRGFEEGGWQENYFEPMLKYFAFS